MTRMVNRLGGLSSSFFGWTRWMIDLTNSLGQLFCLLGDTILFFFIS